METTVIQGKKREAAVARPVVVVDRDGRSATVEVGGGRRALRDDIERSMPRADCDWN